LALDSDIEPRVGESHTQRVAFSLPAKLRPLERSFIFKPRELQISNLVNELANRTCKIGLAGLSALFFCTRTMANTYTVEILHQGQTHTLQVPDDRPVLTVALESGLDLPVSCTAGICTTCAALITEGTVEQPDAMGVSPEMKDKGFALLCVSFARSNLKIQTEKEEEVYKMQFGQQPQR
jgi:ferredoxin